MSRNGKTVGKYLILSFLKKTIDNFRLLLYNIKAVCDMLL